MGGILQKTIYHGCRALKMANFRYWGYSIENHILWMQGSEYGKSQLLGYMANFRYGGYTTKSHVLVIACSENGKFQILRLFIENSISWMQGSDLIMSGTSIEQFRHLEHQNLSIISEDIDKQGCYKKVRSRKSRSRRRGRRKS